MAQKRVVLFGGSFNPFGLHHRAIVELLLKYFDLVIIIPCGNRPDKRTTNDTSPVHRAATIALSLRGLPTDRVRIENFDLENDTFTRNHDLQTMFAHEGELWHAVGADLVQGGAEGKSSIHRIWEKPDFVWNTLNFAVVQRTGYPLEVNDLPPNRLVFNLDEMPPSASQDIRKSIYNGEAIDGLMVPAAQEYVDRHHLYRGKTPAKITDLTLEEPRLILFADTYNPEAMAAAERFSKYEDKENPNLGLVFGGDGTMIDAAHQLWQWRVPLLGINYGHLGYNLNWIPEAFLDELILRKTFKVFQQPLLYVEMTQTDGGIVKGFAYNDAWVVADVARIGRAARMQVELNGRMKMSNVMGDGMLVSTAQGSTAYAHSMGAPRLRYGMDQFQLVGNHIFNPDTFKSALLDANDKVVVKAHPESLSRVGPLYGHIDGRINAGPVLQMAARYSRFAAIELAFLPGQDPDSKMDEAQFPKTN